MIQLSIPPEHYPKIAFFISLPKEIKEKLFEGIRTAKAGVPIRLLVDHIDSKIDQLNKDQIFDLALVYVNLFNAKNKLEVSISEFISLLEQALLETQSKELIPNNQILDDFKVMFESGQEFSNIAKVLNARGENQHIFLFSDIYQDIRPIFNSENVLLGSSIIHNLKITYSENEVSKEFFLSLDSKDIEKFIETFKVAKEKTKLIENQIKDVKLIKV